MGDLFRISDHQFCLGGNMILIMTGHKAQNLRSWIGSDNLDLNQRKENPRWKKFIMKERDNEKQESWLQNFGSHSLVLWNIRHSKLICSIHLLCSCMISLRVETTLWFLYSAKILSFMCNPTTKQRASVHIQCYLALEMSASTAAIPCNWGYQLASPITS